MSVGPTPAIISLPCYHGFNEIAIWPAPQSVSKINDYLKYVQLQIKMIKMCVLIIVIFSACKLLWPDVH